MEDVKKRLEFSNPFVQHQALWKLQAEIEKKAGGVRITEDTPESPEAKTLWDALCGGEQQTSLTQATLTQTAADVWLHLVVTEVADFTYVLHGVLNRVPSARCLVGVARTLGGLLALEAVAVEESGQRYTCPYSLRAPAHPFITVLTHRPTAWALLTSQVEELMLHHDVRVQRLSLEILRPFVSFVLLEPTPSHPQAPLLRLQLQHLLLRLCPQVAHGGGSEGGDGGGGGGGEGVEPWLSFLVDLLPCYQVNTAEAVAHLTDHVRLLLHTLGGQAKVKAKDTDTDTATARDDRCGAGDSAAVRRGQEERINKVSTCDQLLSRVTQTALSLLVPAMQHHLDVQGLLHSVLSAAEGSPQCLAGEGRLTQLCHVLMRLGPFAPPSVLRLVEKAASVSLTHTPSSSSSSSTSSSSSSTTGTTAVAAGMLTLPVLQFLAGPSPPGSSGGGGGGGGAAGGGSVAAARQRQALKWAAAALTSLRAAVVAGQGTVRGEGSSPVEKEEMEMMKSKAKKAGSGLLTSGHLFGKEVESEALADLMTVIATDLGNTCVWLTSLRHHLSGLKANESMSWQTTCVVASVLVLHQHTAVSSLALDVLVHIARLDNTKAPLFLPLVLYCVRERQAEPEARLLLLEHLPLMAQHKLCVPPILKTLQALLTSPKLRALAIRLMTSLWRLQDRCFPQLLKAIGEEEASSSASSSSKSSKSSSSSSSSVLLSPDVLLAKAAAVKEMCRLRPEQHGADLLAPLSHILQTATDQQGAPPSALAMEGLYYLCEAEVIDIQSAWNVLAEQLASEKRGVVLVRVCQLLSLVPSLAVSTPEYEEFQRDAVSRLWSYTQSSQISVQGAAFRALSHFSAVDHFRVSHLPRQVCEELHLQAEMMQQQQQEQQQQQQEGGKGKKGVGTKKEEEDVVMVTVDTLFTFIPGVSYTRLLRCLPPQVLPDYGEFLGRMVGREVEQLPRGIYHAATRRHGGAASASAGSTNQDKAIASIPQFIGRQYSGSTQQPGLRPSLAAAVLFCFDPPVEVGRDGRPRKHYIVRHGKLYSDTFTTLLNEVPVQPSEWHRSLLMPQAWVAFMERLCLALIESRGAELDLQAKHGHISEDQREEKTNTAWLFARDNIVDILKATSKGTPSQQANAVLALTGLAVFVARYARGLDPEVREEGERATEHLGHAHWLTVAMDTVLSLRDVKYRARGALLGFGLQRSAEDRAAAANLAQATACVCLGALVPCMAIVGMGESSPSSTTTSSSSSSSSDGLVMRHVLRELCWGLPGARKASEYPVLVLHHGLGLGMVLGRLFEEGFCDLGGGQGKQAVWDSLKALEDVCFNPDLDSRSGSILGLGLALTGLCRDGQAESRERVTATCRRLSSLLDGTAPGDHTYQALCFSLAMVMGSAFTSNILKAEDVSAALKQLEMAHSANPQITGCSLGLGMLCYTLSRMGHPGVTELRQRLTSQWLAALTSSGAAAAEAEVEAVPPMVRVAALNGLMALIGSEQTLIVVQAGVSLTSSDVRVSEVVETVTRMVQGDPDLGIQSNAAWMLGHLHLSACSVAENRTSVPPNFGYLPEASFLRAIVDLLLEAGRQGPDTVSRDHMKVALAAIQDDVTRVLPPLNWAGVLSPLLRLDYGEECQRLCLTLALSQGGSAPTAAMMLNSWLTPPLALSLSEKTKRSLFAALPTVLRSVSPAILGTFLTRCCLPALLLLRLPHHHAPGDPNPNPANPGPKPKPPLGALVLRGLTRALRVPDPPEAVTAVLYDFVRQAYAALPASEFCPLLFRGMAECLSLVPDDIFDAITAEDYASGACSLRGFFIGCYLVARGSQPITLLNGLIDSAMNSPQCGGDGAAYLLGHCLWEVVTQRREAAGPMERLNWLLELLGHTRNVATRALPLNCPTQPLRQAVDFAVLVVAMAFTLLTSAQPSCDLGLDPALLKVKGRAGKGGAAEEEGRRKEEPVEEAALPGWSGQLRRMFLAQLPVAVLAFERTPWDQLLPKVFDWLLTMSRLSDDVVSADIKHSVNASLLMLRHSTEFRKTNNWTRVLTTV